MALPTLSVVMLASVVGMGVAFLVWLNRDRPGAGALATFVVAASFWTAAYGLELAVPDVETMARLVQIQLTLSVIIPISWLVVVFEYTGHPYWLTRRRISVLLIEPALFVTLVWSNPAHGLVWESVQTETLYGTNTFVPVWGLARWGHAAYMLLLVLSGGVLLFQMVLKEDTLFRRQGVALLIAITVPMVAHSAHLLDVFPTPFDPTSLGYVVSGIVLSMAILRGQLFDITPVTRELGREAIFAEIDDRVVIVDDRQRIVDVNQTAGDLFEDDPVELLGRPLAGELPELADDIPAIGERAQTETTLDVNGTVRYYDVRVTPLYRAYGAISGHLISLRDVTDRRQREERLDVLNRLLRHDIRNEMNVVRGNAVLLRDESTAEERERLDRIVQTVDRIVGRSNKVGQVSDALEREFSRPVSLSSLLEPVVRDAREQYPTADISLSCPNDIWVESGPSLTLAFEELLDNATEHSAGDVIVDITVDPNRQQSGVVVRLSDDGTGIDAHEREVIKAGEETPLKHGSGVGLWLVTWVVRNAGGTLSFVEEDGAGTTVELVLPRADPPDDERDAGTSDDASGQHHSTVAGE